MVDFGPLVPDIIKLAGLYIFLGFATVLGALMMGDISEVDRALTFLGLRGEFPNPDNDVLLRIFLPVPMIE